MKLLISFIIGIYAAFKVLAMYADNLNNKEAKEHQKKYLELDKTVELFAKKSRLCRCPPT